MCIANIYLKNGEHIVLEDFCYLSYLDENKNPVKVYEYETFHMNDKFVNFISKKSILSTHTNAIEFIHFSIKHSDVKPLEVVNK